MVVQNEFVAAFVTARTSAHALDASVCSVAAWLPPRVSLAPLVPPDVLTEEGTRSHLCG
jgi:hypothetical protein